MVFLTFGTGFGAGLILDGKLYSGTNDMAGEIGHVRCEPDGPVGYGKAGSFEGFCSGGGIEQLSGGRSAREVVELADRGDRAMLDVLRLSAEKLGLCLSLLIDLLNPERIVVGSIYARASPLRVRGEAHDRAGGAPPLPPGVRGRARAARRRHRRRRRADGRVERIGSGPVLKQIVEYRHRAGADRGGGAAHDDVLQPDADAYDRALVQKRVQPVE